jgi:glycine cleavage system H protein
LANSDPEGAGWFYKVQLNHAPEVDDLMDAAAYQAFAGQ